MCTTQLEDVVLDTVHDFMAEDKLFTALDVSNQVKKLMPQARHKEVRNIIRSTFATDIEPCGWARTPIKVTLVDGTQANALLYHPTCDSFDLDNKYGAQFRDQTIGVAPQPVNPPTPAPIAPAPPLVNSIPQTVPAIPPFATARTMWDNLFKTQPSLFPTKQ